MKRCGACRRELDASAFSKLKSSKDGLAWRCRGCDRAARLRWESGLTVQPPSEKWCAGCVSTKLTSGFYAGKTKRRNPDRVTASEEKRRARKKGTDSTGVSVNEWRAVLDAFDHRCAYCYTTGRMSMDHFRPLAHGGKHSPDNVVPACRSCNSSKADDLIFSWLPRFERSGRLARHAKAA
jgi:5-methylcytosine-specific restriction endonuclease McrA